MAKPDEKKATPEEAPKAAKAPKAGDSITVTNPRQGTTRTFTLEEQGEGYAEAAESFRKKFGGEIVK